MKRILFITSQYRVGERIYPILPQLCDKYSVDLLKVYQMSQKHKWVGDIDLRATFDSEYLHMFNEVFEDNCDVSKYDLIISDDNRNSHKTNFRKLYDTKGCDWLACSHGNSDKPYFDEGLGVVFDKCVVFGDKDVNHNSKIALGIPSNDALENYMDSDKKHILVIVNFLGNRKSPFRVNFDETFFKNPNLIRLQKHYGVPIVFKLKSRADERGYKHNVDYIKKVTPSELDFSVIVDVENDNKLISESVCVISAPSTFAFKSIQLNIPTMLIKDSGQLGSFYDFNGVLDFGEGVFEYLTTKKDYTDWLNRTIAGSTTFASTNLMINYIDSLL